MGGGQRTKETNLNEMTCFGGVKSGELGFSVPSPRRHIHLERPDLRVYIPEHINRHTEQMGRVKKIGGAKKKKKSERERQGSSLIICRQQASLFFERQKHILNSSRALKVCYLKGISLKATTTRISMSVKVKTELTLLAFERKKKEAMELREVWSGLRRRRGGEGGSSKRATRFLQGPPALLNIPAILCIWKWVSSLKWRSGKGEGMRGFSCGGGPWGGGDGQLVLRVEVCARWMDVALSVGVRTTAGPL